MVFISYLPASVCLFWFATNFFLPHRTGTSGIIQILLAVLGVLFFTSADIALTDSTDGGTLALFFTRQFVTPFIIPLFMAYLKQRTATDNAMAGFLIWTALPVSMLFAELVLLVLIGVPGCSVFVDLLKQGADITSMPTREMQIMYICCVYIFRATVILETAFLSVRVLAGMPKEEYGSLWSFLFKGGKSSVIRLQGSGMLFLTLLILALLFFQGNGVSRFRIQSVLYLAIAATVYASALMALHQNSGYITVSDILSKTGFDDSSHSQSDAAGLQAAVPGKDSAGNRKVTVTRESVSMAGMKKAAVPDITENDTDDVCEKLDAEEESRLRMKFEDLMFSEQPFLRQGIKLSDIAAMLETNRTYISRLVNSSYGMSFTDYVNTLRIDYAKQYLLENRNARQSDIAAACGFPNAPSFNSIFKKATGMTPKIWLATRTEGEEQ